MTKLSDQLKPLSYVNILFGLPGYYKKTNILLCLYTIFLVTFIPMYILYTLFLRIKPAKPGSKPITKMSISSLMNYLQVQLVIMVVYSIYIRNYTRRFVFQYLIQHIELVDEKLQQIFHFENSELKIATMAQLPVIIIYGSTQGINFGFKIIILKRNYIQSLISTFVNTLLFLIMFQMVLYSKILKNRFDKLNVFLVKLITRSVYSGENDKQPNHPHSDTVGKHKRFHILNVSSIYEINHQLKQLAVLHYELNKICDAFNNSYNIQITIIITVTVLGVASMLQTTTTNMINLFYKNAKILGFILYVCFWIGMGMLCLFWLISNISSLQTEEFSYAIIGLKSASDDDIAEGQLLISADER
ncbi:hypothetical protein M8J77_020270 [Diaphorina citri]|nr:hypothetical protein M8J77_020270 [Diaphorina citri]